MRKNNKRKKKLNLLEKLKFKKKEKNEDKLNNKNVNKKKNNNVLKKKTNVNSKTNNVPANKKVSEKRKKITNKPKRSVWKKIVTGLLIAGIIGVLLVASFFVYIVLSAPKFNEAAFDVKDQTIIYDINGDIIAKLGVEKRESVTYDQLPQVLIDAIIATEDSRFFQHNGVDLPRFIKASIFQLLGRSDAGGASTLTMQMVKNSLTSTEDSGIKGIIRKFQDVYLSVFKVEKNYTKEEIIELYVNNHCLGASVYGVGEASKYYFGKTVSELTLPEASLLAGLFQAPNRHNPYKNIESATSRRNTVLNLMVRHGYITKEEANMAKQIDISTLLVGIQDAADYQGYVDNIVKEVKDLTGSDPAIVPMKIYTTMETKIQDGINKILKDKEWYWINDKIQAGIAVINVKTGAIAALGSGRNREGQRIFNYATEALRQPGSTAKPIFAYGPTIEYNNASTYGFYVDEPWAYTDGPSINNWDGDFHGIVTTRYALQYSRNIPALKAYQQVGSKKIQQFAYSIGLDVSYNQNSENYRIINEATGLDNTINEAYSIGGVSEGFSPLMMASAYSAFASGGYYTPAYSVTKIEFRETGEVIEYKPSRTRVMKDSTAYLMNNILESAVVAGFNGGARVSGSHVAAKTGTSNLPDSIIKKYNLPGHAVNDLWTVAYTSEYSIAVWYGYDEVTSETYNTDGNGKRKDAVMQQVMKYIPKDTKGWKQPSSVVATQVEKETYPAQLPSEYTPKNMIVTEYFVRGTQPTEVSDRYKKLDDVTNQTITTNGNNVTLSWTHSIPRVLTDEYLDNYFSRSIYGNTKEERIEERKKYNTEKLGDIVYAIYKENADGSLELIGTTLEQTYTCTAYETTNYIVKVEHGIFKDNASNGVKLTANIVGGSSTPNNSINAALEGELTVTASVGNYTELGIKSIFYGTEDISSTANVKYQIVNNGMITECSTLSDLQNAVNKLPAGTYKLNYIISYDGNELIKPRNVTLK